MVELTERGKELRLTLILVWPMALVCWGFMIYPLQALGLIFIGLLVLISADIYLRATNAILEAGGFKMWLGQYIRRKTDDNPLS